MDIRFNKQKLSQILEDVYELLKTPISIFDGEFCFVASYPPDGKLTDFCTMIREDAHRANQCAECDKAACLKCKQTGQTFSYLCHAGIRETVTPIRFENEIIGYILFGEYRVTGEETDVEGYAVSQGMNAQTLCDAHRRLTVLTEKQVGATCNVLQSCALQFWLTDAILMRRDELAEKIKEYVAQNLHLPLTVEQLCQTFYVGRRQLYDIFKENFGASVKQYVLDKKTEKAKTLLSKTDLSVQMIAERCGFCDYNNFIQRFKKQTGFTPTAYRKK